MRVLMLNERDLTHPLAGGAEVHLEEIASRLHAAHGIETTVLCAGYPGGAPEEMRRGIRYCRFGNRFTYYPQVPLRARREVAGGDYALVVENLCKLLYFSQLYLPRIPKLGLVHHLFGMSAFQQVMPPVAAFVVASEALLPILYRRWPFVVVSPSTRDDLVRRGIPAANVRVIPNGIDGLKFCPGAPAVEADLVVFVGRVEHYKGVDLLLDAWLPLRARCPRARLVIVGEGSALPEMRRRSSAAAFAGSVSFTGFVPESSKIEWLRRATVVVQPSRKEGWGLTVVEANACGTPVVANDVPGLRDSVRHGETGLIAARGSESAFAAALASILSDPELRARLALGARRWAARFTWEAAAEAMATVIVAAARRKPLPAVPELLGPALDAASEATPARRAIYP